MSRLRIDVIAAVCCLASVLWAEQPFVPGGPCTRGRVRIEGIRVVSDWGTPLRGACWAQWGLFKREEMTAVKNAGLNAIHLYAAQVHNDGDPSTDWRNTDSIVEWARQESLYVVMLCGGGANQGAATMIGLARTSWEFYAPRYADQKHVVYELLNEPCLATYYCDEAVMQGIKELYALVRS